MNAAFRPTPEQALALFRARFLNRTDTVAVQGSKHPFPIDVEGALDDLLRAHLLGDAAPAAKVRFKNRRAQGAMAGRFRVGSYCLSPDHLARWLCVDLDGAGHALALADPVAVARATCAAFEKAGLPAYLERSGGGHGWHVWVFFDPPIAAEKAQALGRALVPKDALLANGGVADASSAKGIEVFPKQGKLRGKGLGNQVWLPWWHGAPEGANVFHRFGDSGAPEPYLPEDLQTARPEDADRVLAALPTAAVAEPQPERGDAGTAAENPALETLWAEWRKRALAALPLDAVYGRWLTGVPAGAGWLQCRDPASPSGDQDPSASVADGTGEAERGAFHSFRTEKTIPVFDFLMAHGGCADFRAARDRVAELSGVPLPPPVPVEVAASPRRPRRPRIRVNGRLLDEVVAEAWHATALANARFPSLFRRGTSLVRLARSEDGCVIESLTEAGVLNHLADVAEWVRAAPDGDVCVFPSKDAARALLDRPDASLPILEAVVAAPVLGPDGRVVLTPGYHAGARLWYAPPHGLAVPPVPDRPTERDVAAARDLLLVEVLGDFRFVDTAARAHMVAAMLLPFVRRLIQGATPIHLFEAPTEGSGKGLMGNIVALLATGACVTGGSIPQEEEEVRKKIGAELSTGRPLLVLDNADNKKRLDSAALASATTMWPHWSDRLLGHNKMFTAPNQAVWILTGNNPKLSRELARRCVSVRIDPGTDRPWLRSGFRHPDLVGWITEHRGELIHAVLVLAQNWLARGRPKGTTRLGSFERWSETVGGILAAAGIEGFLGNLEALYATADAEGTMWRTFVAAWWEEYADAPVRIADLVELCAKGELMAPVLGDGTDRSQRTRLGNALQTARDRVFATWRIENAGRDSHTKAAQYRLREAEVVGGPATPAPAPAARPDASAEPDFLPSLSDFEEAL